MAVDFTLCDRAYAETLPTGRTYFTPDGNFPSITTILGKTANNIWLQKWEERVGKEEADRVRQEAADRGTLVHEYLERYWNRENSVLFDLKQESSDVILMTQSLIDYTLNKFDKVYAQELTVWSKELGIAGRFDALVKYEGTPAVIDFKTSKKKKYKCPSDYYLQSSFYAIALNEMFGLKIKNFVVLIVNEKGDVEEFKGNYLPHVGSLKGRVRDYHIYFGNA